MDDSKLGLTDGPRYRQGESTHLRQDMIQAGLQFWPSDKEKLVRALLTLPRALRPTHKSDEEDEIGDEIGNSLDVINAARESDSGFFLKGPQVTYNLRFAGNNNPIFCDCFLEVSAVLAEQLLLHMASAQPRFGFACEPEEREARNRITKKVGANTVESWVGRDVERYVPGFYWLTVLSAELIEKHDIPLPQLERAAQGHMRFEDGGHLFRL